MLIKTQNLKVKRIPVTLPRVHVGGGRKGKDTQIISRGCKTPCISSHVVC